MSVEVEVEVDVALEFDPVIALIILPTISFITSMIVFGVDDAESVDDEFNSSVEEAVVLVISSVVVAVVDVDVVGSTFSVVVAVSSVRIPVAVSLAYE